MSAALVVNAGSTSLKLRLVDGSERVEPVESLADVDPASIEVVAHRIVHGGAAFREPALVDEAVRGRIRELEAIAPLHNAPALEALDRARAAVPDAPHVAVFDTAFHATLPPAAAEYALPGRWREEWGVRRFGFHGLSVAWCAERAPRLLGSAVRPLRLVVCHLGGGCSVSAVLDGRSVDTSMGFTPLEGVPMTTRSGSIDPGLLIYALRERGLDAAALDRELNLESGLAGLAGGAPEGMLGIERAAAAGDPDASLARDVFVHRLAGAVAAMAASLGGIDALAFTAGIGEGSADVRGRTCERLRFLGVELDPDRNEAAEPDLDVASAGSRVRVLVIRAREELVAARAARGLLGAG